MFDRIFSILETLDRAPPQGRADPRLDRLFASLGRAPTRDVAETIEGEIWEIWGEASDEVGRKMMQEAAAVLAEGRNEDARDMFAKLIDHDPDFTEAWNKRATALFLLEDHGGSVTDIEETLTREPRHFGALSGLAQIMMAAGEWHGAEAALTAALRVNPHLRNVRTALETLARRNRRTRH